MFSTVQLALTKVLTAGYCLVLDHEQLANFIQSQPVVENFHRLVLSNTTLLVSIVEDIDNLLVKLFSK